MVDIIVLSTMPSATVTVRSANAVAAGPYCAPKAATMSPCATNGVHAASGITNSATTDSIRPTSARSCSRLRCPRAAEWGNMADSHELENVPSALGIR